MKKILFYIFITICLLSNQKQGFSLAVQSSFNHTVKKRKTVPVPAQSQSIFNKLSEDSLYIILTFLPFTSIKNNILINKTFKKVIEQKAPLGHMIDILKNKFNPNSKKVPLDICNNFLNKPEYAYIKNGFNELNLTFTDIFLTNADNWLNNICEKKYDKLVNEIILSANDKKLYSKIIDYFITLFKNQNTAKKQRNIFNILKHFLDKGLFCERTHLKSIRKITTNFSYYSMSKNINQILNEPDIIHPKNPYLFNLTCANDDYFDTFNSSQNFPLLENLDPNLINNNAFHIFFQHFLEELEKKIERVLYNNNNNNNDYSFDKKTLAFLENFQKQNKEPFIAINNMIDRIKIWTTQNPDLLKYCVHGKKFSTEFLLFQKKINLKDAKQKDILINLVNNIIQPKQSGNFEGGINNQKVINVLIKNLITDLTKEPALKRNQDYKGKDALMYLLEHLNKLNYDKTKSYYLGQEIVIEKLKNIIKVIRGNHLFNFYNKDYNGNYTWMYLFKPDCREKINSLIYNNENKLDPKLTKRSCNIIHLFRTISFLLEIEPKELKKHLSFEIQYLFSIFSLDFHNLNATQKKLIKLHLAVNRILPSIDKLFLNYNFLNEINDFLVENNLLNTKIDNKSTFYKNICLDTRNSEKTNLPKSFSDPDFLIYLCFFIKHNLTINFNNIKDLKLFLINTEMIYKKDTNKFSYGKSMFSKNITNINDKIVYISEETSPLIKKIYTLLEQATMSSTEKKLDKIIKDIITIRNTIRNPNQYFFDEFLLNNNMVIFYTFITDKNKSEDQLKIDLKKLIVTDLSKIWFVRNKNILDFLKNPNDNMEIDNWENPNDNMEIDNWEKPNDNMETDNWEKPNEPPLTFIAYPLAKNSATQNYNDVPNQMNTLTLPNRIFFNGKLSIPIFAYNKFQESTIVLLDIFQNNQNIDTIFNRLLIISANNTIFDLWSDVISYVLDQTIYNDLNDILTLFSNRHENTTFFNYTNPYQPIKKENIEKEAKKKIGEFLSKYSGNSHMYSA